MRNKATLHEIPRCKTTLQPVIPTNTILHPGLCTQRTLQDVLLPQVQQVKRLHTPRKHKKKRVRNKNLEKLIKEYSKIAKVVRTAKTNILKPLPTHIARAYAPTPKSYKARTTTVCPMQLRHRHMIRDPTTPSSYKKT